MNQARLLGGRYQLGELLGYGGMAEVHRGRDQRLGRDVAVKVLRADLARDPNFQARFRREAQNAAALNHPAIVAVYDTGEDHHGDENLPYIVMEYVEGRTLKEAMQDEGPLMPQRSLEIVADVCAALDFSHKHGIVHRDIKPGNVMLTRSGAVKVMDFGIARAVASETATMTATSAVVGTAQYLSPEQARGESVDARSDVYSTGCLLYELLTGNPPFTGDNPVSVAYQHVRENPIPPSELNREVTPEMDAVVMKAMAKNPANRYQGASEMRDDLLRAAAGRRVSAPAVMTAVERTQLLPAARTTMLPRHDDYGDEYPEGAEKKSSKKRKALIWAMVGLGLIALFSGVAWGTSKFLGSESSQVSVPRVMGDTQEQAERRLADVGLKAKAENTTSTEEDRGKVVNQKPQSGSEVNKGSTVTILIGAGPDTVEVPSLDGLDKALAQQRIEDAGLKPLVQEVSSAQEEGTVLDYSPPAGTTLEKGDEVTLEVSKGDLVLVPNVVGEHEDTAVADLEAEGFEVVKRERETDEASEGYIVDQSPKEGKEVDKGQSVTIWVAVEPEKQTPTPSPEPSTSPSSSIGLPRGDE